MVAGVIAAARGMPPVVAPKAARSIRRRLRRRASRPTEVQFDRTSIMARVGSSTDWQRLVTTVLDGVEALRVSTSQGPQNGQWLRGLLCVQGEGARIYDGAINNFLQDCRRALRGKKVPEPDSQGPEPIAVLESSQATEPDDQGAEPRELPGSSLDIITPSETPRTAIGRDAFILESDSEAEAAAAAPSHGPQERRHLGKGTPGRALLQALGKPKKDSKFEKKLSFGKKRRDAVGWTTLDVRARNMRLHFDSNETLHVPATEESVDMLLAELNPRKEERRRKKNSIVAQTNSVNCSGRRTRAGWRGADTRGRCSGGRRMELTRRP